MVNHGVAGRGHEQRRAAGHHVYAGRNHRGGVDERADGRGAFHRVGQPNVQRKLRAFAARPGHQQQTNRHRDTPPVANSAGLASRCLPQHASDGCMPPPPSRL